MVAKIGICAPSRGCRLGYKRRCDIGEKFFPGFVITRVEMKYLLWNTGFPKLIHKKPRDLKRCSGRFENDAIARHQGRQYSSRRNRVRKIPRRYYGDDTECFGGYVGRQPSRVAS